MRKDTNKFYIIGVRVDPVTARPVMADFERDTKEEAYACKTDLQFHGFPRVSVFHPKVELGGMELRRVR